MSKAVFAGQARSLLASFVIDTPWEEIEADVQPFIELPPKQRGKRFAAFIENEFRITCDTELLLKKPFNPAAFVGGGWDVWLGPSDGDGFSGDKEDLRTLPLKTMIRPARFVRKTCLRPDEEWITGEEKLRRLKEEPDLFLLDGSVFIALWDDYQTNKREESVLEWIFRNMGVTFLDFLGLPLRNPGGNRSVLYLDRVIGGWSWHASQLKHRRNAPGVSGYAD